MKKAIVVTALFCSHFATQAQQRKNVGDFQNQSFSYQQRTPAPPPPPNAQHTPYRTIDGTNNNLIPNQQEWGASDIPLLREMPAEYGSSDPKNAMGGATRPSAREISNLLCDEPVTQFNSRNLSAFVYIWGQFIDHDITLTPTGSTESVPITLPADEPLFTVAIPFSRSEVHTGTGTKNVRQQSNLSTSWIDASMVYGSDDTRAAWLRSKKNGKMRLSLGNNLPWNTTTGEQSGVIDPTAPSMANDANYTVKTYVAGDIRAAEHPALTSLHTLFVREHNKICDKLIAQGLTNDEEIYQRARKEVGALIQVITYQEFLPAMGVVVKSYNGYRNNVCPDITNGFATAGYRMGHTMVADELALRNNKCEIVGPGSLELLDVFFNPQVLADYGPEVFLKGLTTHKQYETDTKINSVLRNFLFGSPTSSVRFGLDLAAINIQRGRDHGLPNYNATRAFYTGSPVKNFSQITSDATKAASLQKLYGNVNNIDLWVGILSEDRLPGKSLGKTMHEMLRVQFEKLRDGDFYYYQNDPFLPNDVRNQVSRTRLSEVIKRNTTLTNLPDNVFFISTCPGENGETIAKSNARIANTPLESPENIEGIMIYPNPVKNILNVNLKNQIGASTIQLYSINGSLEKIVEVNSGEGNIKINVENLSNGVHFMNISNDRKIRTFKFIKVAE
ncbi:peroxidase family protein [Runella sp.]|uniref:peroxidase family protein n=1 Tax=Runella sp. TaxID=1960881 RepID=UPI00301AF893